MLHKLLQQIALFVANKNGEAKGIALPIFPIAPPAARADRIMSSAPPLPPSLNDLSGAAGSPSPGSSHEKDFVRCDQLLEKTLRTSE
jgi:hypothetical protein